MALKKAKAFKRTKVTFSTQEKRIQREATFFRRALSTTYNLEVAIKEFLGLKMLARLILNI